MKLNVPHPFCFTDNLNCGQQFEPPPCAADRTLKQTVGAASSCHTVENPLLLIGFYTLSLLVASIPFMLQVAIFSVNAGL